MELGYVKVKWDFYTSISMMISLKYVYTGILLVTKILSVIYYRNMSWLYSWKARYKLIFSTSSPKYY